MYTLYYGKGAASLAIHAALREIGVPFELRALDLDAGEQRSAAYLALNPAGRVPTLLIEGQPFHESVALMMTLAERHPLAGLAPAAGTLARADWNSLLLYMANELGSQFRLWFYPSDLGGRDEDGPLRAAIRQRIEACWERLDARLAAGGPYLLGEQCSGADLMLTMYMRWSRNMPRPATDWPALRQLADRIRARPSWRQVSATEALSAW